MILYHVGSERVIVQEPDEWEELGSPAFAVFRDGGVVVALYSQGDKFRVMGHTGKTVCQTEDYDVAVEHYINQIVEAYAVHNVIVGVVCYGRFRKEAQ